MSKLKFQVAMDIPSINIDLSITDQQHCEASARKLLKIVRPHWDPSKISFEVYTAGITNKIMTACANPKEKVVFRIFGKNTENFIDRDRELNAMEKLANNGLAAPVYATFNNGILCGFLPGDTLKAKQLKNLDIQRRICETMAAFHSLNAIFVNTSDVFLFRKTKDFIRNIDMSRVKELPSFAQKLPANLNELYSLIVPLNEEITFCHNDLLAHNIVFEEESEKVMFIDYEYADFNYTLFDIANHFCEFAGVEDPDYNLCPDREEMRTFLQFYLEARHDHVDEVILARMLDRVSLFQASAHLLWSAWALVQAQNSTLDFDYASYATTRYEQYEICLNNYLMQDDDL